MPPSGDEIDAELALRRFDRVDLARGNVKAFGADLEVVDERLHGALHLGAPGRDDFVIMDCHGPLPFRRAQLLQALFHDLGRLAHLLHADAVAILIVAVLADRDVKIELGITFGELRLRRSQAAPEPRTMTPENPHPQASASVTAPMPTLRCLKMRLSVSSTSISSHTLRNGSQKVQMSSMSFGGKSWCTPPTRK